MTAKLIIAYIFVTFCSTVPAKAFQFGDKWGYGSCPICGASYRHVARDFLAAPGNEVYIRKHLIFLYSGVDRSGWKGYVVARDPQNTGTVTIFHLENMPSYVTGQDLNNKMVGVVANLGEKSPPHIHLGYRKESYYGKMSIQMAGALPDCDHKPNGLPRYPEKFVNPDELGELLVISRSKLTKIEYYNSKTNIIQPSTDILNDFNIPSQIVLKELPYEYKNKNGDGYNIDVRQDLFYDLKGDGRDEAVIVISYWPDMANYGMDDICVHSNAGGRLSLVGKISETMLNSTYKKYYPGGYLWPGHTELSGRNGVLYVQKLADGYHAQPDFVVKFAFKYNGVSFVPLTAPQRKKFEE